MFDADSSGALDAVELTRALEIQEAARTAKQTPGEKLTTAQNNPYTADDTWNCMGAGGRCDESSDSSSKKKTAKSEKKNGDNSKKVKALAAAQNNPYTADDTWNCMGAG